MTRVCSGCGLHSCQGECFDQSPDPTDEPTVSELTLEDLRKIYGSPLVELLPENRWKWVA